MPEHLAVHGSTGAGLSVGKHAAQPPWLERGLRWLGRQRWLRYGLRRRVLWWLAHPERSPDRHFETEFAGFTYPGHLQRWIDWIVYYEGGYELDELELMRELMRDRPAPVALDIGANVGHHTLYMASFCQHVHAFEPYDGVGRCIDEKIARNGLQNVTVHRVGMGEHDEELDYYAPKGHNIGTGSFVPGHEASNNVLLGRLKLVDADAYMDGLALDHVDLVKIDVEGFELSVIRGMARSLARYRPVIVMELADATRAQFSSMEAFLTLFPPGYRVDEVQSLRPRWGVLARQGCALATPDFSRPARPGHYMNLLLRPDA